MFNKIHHKIWQNYPLLENQYVRLHPILDSEVAK